MGRSVVALIIFGLILLAGQLDKLGGLGNLGGPKVTVPHVSSAVCRDPKEHVYHPDRLSVIDPCIQVTGTIRSVRFESDGDYHVLLEPDPQFANLVNDANRKLQRGWLVMEPICVSVPKDAVAKEACGDYINPLTLPEVGQHVVVIGPYVLDTEHSSWAEIHPLWSINSL